MSGEGGLGFWIFEGVWHWRQMVRTAAQLLGQFKSALYSLAGCGCFADAPSLSDI